MKEFLRFLIVKTFFAGFRKFVTLAAIGYALHNFTTLPDSEVSRFDAFTDEEIMKIQKKVSSKRLPANLSDSIESYSLADRTENSVSRKERDFFEQNGASEGLPEDGASETVSEVESEIENSVDRRRGVSGRGIASVDSNSTQSSDSSSPGLSKNTGSNVCNSSLDPTCGGVISSFTQPEICNPETDDDCRESTPEANPPTENVSVPVKEISCNVDKDEGNFGAGISVNIIPTEVSAQITYCVGVGASSFCDVYGSGTDYTSTLNFSSDGIYNLTFYCRSSDGYTTEEQTLTYTIDSSLPALIVDFPRIQTQTTEEPITNATQSTDFGKANHFYQQLNLKSHDPTSSGLDWSCEEIKNQYASLVTPSAVVIQGEIPTEGLSALDQIDQTIDVSNLEAGENFIVTLFEDKTRNLISCQVQKVIREDTFNAAFTGTGSTPVSSGVRSIAGGFVGYGHFQATANSVNKGANENQQGFQVNKADLFNIFY